MSVPRRAPWCRGIIKTFALVENLFLSPAGSDSFLHRLRSALPKLEQTTPSVMWTEHETLEGQPLDERLFLVSRPICCVLGHQSEPLVDDLCQFGSRPFSGQYARRDIIPFNILFFQIRQLSWKSTLLQCADQLDASVVNRSEERRVGKECRL